MYSGCNGGFHCSSDCHDDANSLKYPDSIHNYQLRNRIINYSKDFNESVKGMYSYHTTLLKNKVKNKWEIKLVSKIDYMDQFQR